MQIKAGEKAGLVKINLSVDAGKEFVQLAKTHLIQSDLITVKVYDHYKTVNPDLINVMQ